MPSRRDRFSGEDLQLAHIRLPQSLYDRMREEANRNRRTLAEEIRVACEYYLQAEQGKEQRR